MYRDTVGRWLVVGLVMLSPLLLTVRSGGEENREKSEQSVRLVIDYGDGVEKHFTRLDWRAGMTVLDLMEAAGRHPRGIEFAYRGRGPTAFLTRIDDRENEGRGRNWTYRINDRLADRSLAVQTVGPKDRVVWRFGVAPEP